MIPLRGRVARRGGRGLWLLLGGRIDVQRRGRGVARAAGEQQRRPERDMSESRQMYQIAKTALANNEDSEGILREATILNTQSRLLRLSGALRELEDSGSDVAEIADITCKITRALSDIGRLDIMSQKYKTEVRDRAELAANKVEKTAKQKGFSAETIESIKRDILGIAD